MNPNNSSSPQPSLPQSNGIPPSSGESNSHGPSSNPLAVLQTQASAVSNHMPVALNAEQEALLRTSIERARQIVISTAQDPYTQIQELERLKASYIHSRFGKNIKILDS